MGGVWMAARADFRRRWRSAVFVTLVIGIAGSVVLTAFAGARRTSSAFDRLRDETRAGQVTVNTFRVDPRFAAQLWVQSLRQPPTTTCLLLRGQWKQISISPETRQSWQFWR